MDSLEFNQNWNNKLTGKAFTTIRLHNSNRYFSGNEFRILLKGQFLGKAEVVSVKSFTLDKLNEFITYLDTGYGVEETKNIIRTMYKNQGINWETQFFDFVLLLYD